MNDTLDKAPNEPPDLKLTRPSEDTLLVRLNGTWKLGDGTPAADELLGQVHSDPRLQRVVFDTRGLRLWALFRFFEGEPSFAARI